MGAAALRLTLAGLALAAGCAPGPHVSPPGGPALERTDAALQAAVERAVAGFDGRVGVYVRHLPTGRTAAVAADSVFPSASLVKVPILVGVADAVERGALGWDDPLVFRDSLRYDAYGLFGQLRDSAAVPLHRAVEAMLSASDNTASLWLQGLVGGEAINAWLAAEGFAATRVNSRTPGREAAREAFGWGQTTPREIAELVRRVAQGQAVAPGADEAMARALGRTFYAGEAVGQVPPTVAVLSKQGAVSDARSEVLYVAAPSGPYLLAVLTDGQADTGWAPDNAGWVLIRELSALAWRAFEPASPWRPAPGRDRFGL